MIASILGVASSASPSISGRRPSIRTSIGFGSRMAAMRSIVPLVGVVCCRAVAEPFVERRSTTPASGSTVSVVAPCVAQSSAGGRAPVSDAFASR